MSHREQVLVVDEMSDTAEVLRAVLEPRGLSVNRLRRHQVAAPPVEGRPAVVVLDAESLDAPSAEKWQNIPLVVIGQVRLTEPGKPSASKGQVERHFLEKPFQFPELVQAIERMIARQPPIG